MDKIHALINGDTDLSSLNICGFNIKKKSADTVESDDFRSFGIDIKPNISIYPDGYSFLGFTDAFGINDIPLEGALLFDEREYATLYFQDNFTFDKLVEGLSPGVAELFVFDEVKINYEKKDDEIRKIAVFTGKLRIDSPPLAPFKDFLKLSEGIYFSGEIDFTNDDANSGKINSDEVNLVSVKGFRVDINSKIILTSAAIKLSIKKKIEDPQTELWVTDISITGKLNLEMLSGRKTNMLDCLVRTQNDLLYFSAEGKDIAGVLDIAGLNFDSFKVQFDINNIDNIDLAATLHTSHLIFNFTGKITPDNIGFISSNLTFTLDEVDDLFKSVFSTKLFLPDFEITFENMYIGFASAECTINNIALKKGFTLGGTTKIYDFSFSSVIYFYNNKALITGYLGDIDIGPVAIKGAKLETQIYLNSTGKPAEFLITGQTHLHGIDTECVIRYEKHNDTWALVIYAFLLENLSLATIFPQVDGTIINTLKFSKAAFIYSSENITTQDPNYTFKVRKGLQLMGILDEIPILSTLTGSKQTNLILSANFDETTDISILLPNTSLDLGNSVKCDPLEIVLGVTENPSFDLVFGVDIAIPKQDDPLHFELRMELMANGARGSGTMENWWINPFGLKGLKIGPDLAIQIGIDYEKFAMTGLPSEFGFLGGLAFGSVTAAMALNISQDPTRQILLGSLQKLEPKDLVEFIKIFTGLDFPGELIPNFFEIQNLEIYCAPYGGSIGSVTFEKGLSFSGNLLLFGNGISVFARFTDEGLVAKGEIVNLEIGPLKIEGEDGKNAEIDLVVTGNNQSASINGAIKFLGLNNVLFAKVSNKGVAFRFEESLFNNITISISGVSQGSLSDPTTLEYQLFVDFTNELTNYIKREIAKKFDEAVANIGINIETAQNRLSEAERNYREKYDPLKKEFDNAQAAAIEYLGECQKKLGDEKDKYDAAFNKAQGEVDNAKANYENVLNTAKEVVDKAQEAYSQVFRNAEDSVTKAQDDYNREIKNAAETINETKREYEISVNSIINKVQRIKDELKSVDEKIDDIKRKISKLKRYERLYKEAALRSEIALLEIDKNAVKLALKGIEETLRTAREAGERSIEIANQRLEAVKSGEYYVILETAKRTLQEVTYGGEYVALTAAKQSFSLIERGSEFLVWQKAIDALNIVQTTGRLGLTAAEETLKNIGQSAAYISVEAAKMSLDTLETTTIALVFRNASAILEGVKQTAEVLQNISEYMLSNSVNVFDIRQGKLTGNYNAVSQGSPFNAKIDINVLGKSFEWTLDFNIRDSVSFIESIFKQVLEQGKLITQIQ